VISDDWCWLASLVNLNARRNLSTATSEGEDETLLHMDEMWEDAAVSLR